MNELPDPLQRLFDAKRKEIRHEYATKLGAVIGVLLVNIATVFACWWFLSARWGNAMSIVVGIGVTELTSIRARLSEILLEVKK